MSTQSSLSRRLIAATVVVASAATSVVLVADAAQADSHAFIRPTSWAYTDSAAPDSTFTGATVDAQIGSWTDSAGNIHTSRSYFTWDLSAYVGATVNPTAAVAAEKAVNNCASERRIYLWETATPTGPITWNNPPAEQRKASTASPATPACPAPYMEFDVTDAVRRALRGTGILTLEVRVPGNAESDVAFGRSLANSLAIQINYNHAPNPPFDLRVNGVACGPDPLQVNALQPYLYAKLTDPDVNATGGGQDPLSAIFQVWPAGQPELVTEVRTGFNGYTPTYAQITVPAGVLADGGKYVFKAKANDGQVDSKPSVGCRFNVDVTRPTTAPTVTSTDYPAGTVGYGGPGIPGTFTFSAGGDKDITGFWYGQYGQTYVAADRPGGTATVAITPTQPGLFQLSVAGTDKAHNFGPSTTYTFYVNNNAPQIGDSNPQGDASQPRTFTFAPGMDGVVSYVYQFNDGAETTVAAGADATASVSISAFRPGSNTLTVRSVTATGYRSYEARYGFYLPSSPTVSSDQWTFDTDIVGAPAGTTGTLTFTPVMGEVTSYTWDIDWGIPETVTAAADGTATVSYTPTDPGYHFINVVGHTADGDTETGTYYFVVG